MPCVATLVVECDQNNKKVDWHLRCTGDCPGGKKCKPVRHGPENTPDGWERYTHECACKRQGDEPTGECKLIVFEYIKTVEGVTRARFKGKCLGHCPRTTTRCRPVVIKEYKLAGEDKDDDEQFDLDDTPIHTIRHYKCMCPDDLT
jgi:hypothetical protein